MKTSRQTPRLRSGFRRKNIEYCSPVLHLFHDRKIPARHQGGLVSNWHLFNEHLLNDHDRFLPSTVVTRAETPESSSLFASAKEIA